MTPEDLIHRVCAARGVSMVQVRSPSRVASVTRARHEAMWVLREETDMSLPEIAGELGRADHTTAIYAIRKIQAIVDADPAYGKRLKQGKRPMRRGPIDEFASELRAAFRDALGTRWAS
jgi:chromosomal replication initiator protein